MSDYGASGTTARSGTTRGTASGHSEEEALLPRDQDSKSSLSTRLNENVSKRRGDLVLLLCYVITGLLDASATAIWGTFVSMQTGNTIYLGLGLADPSASTRWIKSGTSIVCFCLGSFIFARFHRHFGETRRWVLIVSFTFQLAVIIAGAVIVMSENPTTGHPDEVQWHELLALALVAFQSSAQAVTSRALNQNSLTSVVLTSIYCDLWSDPLVFAGPMRNANRNRRLAAPLLLLFGALLGGYWSNSKIGLAGALWTAAGLKLIIISGWVFWPAETRDESD